MPMHPQSAKAPIQNTKVIDKGKLVNYVSSSGHDMFQVVPPTPSSNWVLGVEHYSWPPNDDG